MQVYTAPERRAEVSATWEQGLRRLLEEAAPGSDHQLTFVRAFAGAAHSEQAVADLAALHVRYPHQQRLLAVERMLDPQPVDGGVREYVLHQMQQGDVRSVEHQRSGRL